jgi:iron complex outermembrane recepter protein
MRRTSISARRRPSGIALALSGSAPPTEAGSLRVGLQGTYVRRFGTQIRSATCVSRLADATYGAPLPRWRSTLTLDWARGPWGARLAQVCSSGYVEPLRQPEAGQRRVGAISTWDLQGRYSGFPCWQLAAGIRDLLDNEPPVSIGLTFQFGYNPQVGSPLGRIFYVRASYAVKKADR